MTSLKKELDRMWAKCGGASKTAVRKANKKAAANMAKRSGMRDEWKAQRWKATRAEAKQLARPGPSKPGRTVGALLGQDSFGFGGEYEPKLLKRRGKGVVAPTHWTEEEVEMQELRDLAVLGRAQGTWKGYQRWCRNFELFAKSRGVDVGEWEPNCDEDDVELVELLMRMVNVMKEKYAFGTINMLVTAVARAAKDFGMASPREDEQLDAVLKGIKKLKGLSKKKKMAVLAEHVRYLMDLRKAGSMALERWALLKTVVLVGWMGFFRVSELLGSGRRKTGELADGPSGLDVCDVGFEEHRMVFTVREAKNDQVREGKETVVHARELDQEDASVCAMQRLKEWMRLAGLEKREGCTKGRKGCTECGRPRCICECKACGKLFRNVTHGKVMANPLARASLAAEMKAMYARLEEMGVVEAGSAEQVSGISLRAGGVTEAAANGIHKEILAGHGRWCGVSGPEAYDRNDKRKYKVVSTTLYEAMERTSKKRRFGSPP